MRVAAAEPAEAFAARSVPSSLGRFLRATAGEDGVSVAEARAARFGPALLERPVPETGNDEGREAPDAPAARFVPFFFVDLLRAMCGLDAPEAEHAGYLRSIVCPASDTKRDSA